MKVDIKQITEGEESVVIRYRDLTPPIGKIISIINEEDNRLRGRTDEGEVFFSKDDILYLESVDDKVFVYTVDKVVRIDG